MVKSGLAWFGLVWYGTWILYGYSSMQSVELLILKTTELCPIYVNLVWFGLIWLGLIWSAFELYGVLSIA